MSQSADQALASARELHRSGKNQQAEQCLNQALVEHPDHRPCLQFLGRIHMQTRNFDAAVAVHQRLVDGEPRNASARNSLAMSLFMSGQPERALQEQRLAVELGPGVATYWANLGKLLMTMEDWAGAQDNLEKALSLVGDPNQQQLLELLNACLGNQDKPLRMAGEGPGGVW